VAGINRLEFDPNELNYLHGYLDGVKSEVESTAYVGSVINYAHARMTPRLDAWIDMIAAANPESFHHVYEWPAQYGDKTAVGNPAGRLWKHTLKGHGASKIASFEFKASIKPSPVNPILTKPGSSGQTVKEGIHIFYWKAPAMEYGLEITIRPKLAQYLAFAGTSQKNGIVFSKGPISFTAGGGKTTGRFTNAFRFWWSQMATSTFENDIAPSLSKDLVKGGITGRYRSKSKNFKIAGNSGYSAGKAEALKKLKKNERDYITGAASRIRLEEK